jgi:polyisoprenoid-binding protein YceI
MNSKKMGSRLRAERLLFALPLVLILTAMGCAENPADNVPPAEVSEPAHADDHAGHDHGEDSPGMAAIPEGAEVYVISPQNSTIAFEGSKVTRSHVGGFNEFSGEIALTGGTAEGASVNVTIDTASIFADDPQLTGHLKSPDFFDVKKFPEARFVLSNVTPAGDEHKLTGELTLHGVTRAISFPATIIVSGNKVNASAEFSINRMDFGIEYPGQADDLIRPEVVIRLTISAEAAPA